MVSKWWTFSRKWRLRGVWTLKILKISEIFQLCKFFPSKTFKFIKIFAFQLFQNRQHQIFTSKRSTFFLLRNFFNYLTRKMFISHPRAFFLLPIIFKQISKVSRCLAVQNFALYLRNSVASSMLTGEINLPRSKNHSFVRETYLRMFRGNFLQAKIMKEIFLVEWEVGEGKKTQRDDNTWISFLATQFFKGIHHSRICLFTHRFFNLTQRDKKGFFVLLWQRHLSTNKISLF